VDNYEETEFVRLVKGIMRMNSCSFPEAAEQLILLGRGPGKYRKSQETGTNKSKN